MKQVHLYCLLISGSVSYFSHSKVTDWTQFQQDIKKKTGAVAQSMNCPALHEAAKKGDTKQMQLLLDQGTNINEIGCFWKMTPLQVVIFESLPQEKITIEPVRTSGPMQPMINAIIQSMNTEKRTPTVPEKLVAPTVQWLLNHGASASINNVDSGFHATALHYAAMGGYSFVVEILCNQQANKEIFNIDGYTPLHVATLYNKASCVTMLAKKGADVNAEVANEFKQKAIHLATMQNFKDIIEILLKYQNADVIDAKGNTPLHYAAMMLDTPMIQLLLSHKASKNIKNTDGLTPRGCAAQAVSAKNKNMSNEQLLQDPIVTLLAY